MIFEVLGRILKASWRSRLHLVPLEGLLKHLEHILRALGGLLERLGAILAENVALARMERALTFIAQLRGRRKPVARARGGGVFLAPVIWSKWSRLLAYHAEAHQKVCGLLYCKTLREYRRTP